MIFTKLARAVSLCGLMTVALLLPLRAQAAEDNFNGGAVGSCIYDSPSKTYSCSALSASNDVVIASGYTVVLAGSINFDFNQQLTMSGSARLQTTGSLDIGDIKPSNLNISGGTLVAGTNFKIGDQAQTITANVSAATMTIGTGSTTKITGTLTATGQIDLGSHAIIVGAISASVVTTNSPVTITGAVDASTSFQLASGSTLTGNLTSPKVVLAPSSVTVTGSITAGTSISIGSGNTVNGAIAGGSLSMASSNVTVNGNVTMTGDVSIGSSGTINGDLVARNVTTQSSGDYISGNASVNAIYLDYGARVGKTITCTGAGASGCSCVTRADSNYQPTCGAATPTTAHHIQITHSGTALTCQPQTVTVTACANANCTAPHYNGNLNVVTQPGGKQFTITGGVNIAATVQQSAAGSATLSATGGSNNSTCVNTGGGGASSCSMEFKTKGLTVTAINHVSMAPGATVSIQAFTASNSGTSQTCVPLVASKTVNVTMSCKYNDPVASKAAKIPVKIGTAGTGVVCDGSTSSVPFTFDSSGKASTSLQYAEVGQVGLDASYADANYSVTGSGSFIAAPARFLLVATNAAGVSVGPAALPLPGIVFTKASAPFTVKVTAVNTDGVTTTNFGQENSPEGIDFGWSVINPSDAGNAGQLTVGTFDAFKDGVYSSTSGSTGAWNFNDVGTINVSPKLRSSTYYMGYQTPAFQTKGSQDIARFVPDHFDTVLMSNNEISALKPVPTSGFTMSCSPNSTPLPANLNPCAVGSNSFINSKQPFFIKVLAYNADTTPALTANYAGSLAKPITISAAATMGGAAVTNGAVSWSGSDPKFSFTGGTGTLASPGPSTANLPKFSFTSAYPANDILPSTIYLRAVDTDNVSSRRSVVANSVEAPLTVVSGRLLVANAYGSQNSPLPIDTSAQYYMPSGYVFNSQVNAISATTVASTITFSTCQKALDVSGNGSQLCPGPASLKAVNITDVLTLVNGKGKFRVAAPTPTLTGTGSTNVSPGLLFDYLPSSTGRATFGIYRSGPVIYTREVHN